MQRSTRFLLVGLCLAFTLLKPAPVHGDADLRLKSATSVCASWQATYFDDTRGYQAPPVIAREDPRINFDWGYGSPDSRISPDNFSVSWTRTVDFDPDIYRFTTTTDDGVRLWVDGKVVIDQWRDQWSQSHSGTIYLSGEAVVHMQTYEHTGVALADLHWTRVADAPSDEVTVDGGAAGFVKGGAAAAWHAATGGHGGDLLWTWNNDRVRPGYDWARWYPNLTPGRYEVLIYVPARHSMTSHARYWVSHRGGYSLCPVDQSANDGRWVSLGTYWFQGSRRDYVSLADVTFEPYLSRLIAFDAVRWVAR